MQRHRRRGILLFIAFMHIGICVFAQSAQQSAAQIRIMARPQKEKNVIQLRWAVTDAQAWKLCNRYGFLLERYTVIRNGKVLAVPERKILPPQPIKPKPLAAWDTLAKKDNYAAIIAQALYGEDFEVSGSDGKIAKIYAQSQELDQRFAFSLYAADMSFEGALQAGWGYTDSDIKPNEKYLYRIKTAVPASMKKIDSSSVFIGMADYEPLPKVEEITATFGNKTVIISWDYIRLANYYNAYFIERSEDGGVTFHNVSELPVTNLNEKDGTPSRRMIYIDSLKDNTTTYQYRIKGVNPFGETGPVSEAVGGKGKSLLPYVPNIDNHIIDDKGRLHLDWEFDSAGNDLISGFILNKSVKPEGPYTGVIKNIAPAQRSLVYDSLDASDYFTVTAVAKESESRTSFPVLVQPVDSIPPAVPAGLTATIDSSGIVTLKWNANKEPDLMGYKVFRALKKGEEAVPLVDSVWYINTFKDTLQLKLTNKSAWYGVSALDRRFNQSAISPLVEVKKPSKIPPSPAVFTKYNIAEDTVTLRWINSSDSDIVACTLYRRKQPDSSWGKLQTFIQKGVNSYPDITTATGTTYDYMLEVKNASGLAAQSEILTINTLRHIKGKSVIDRFYAMSNPANGCIDLSWSDKLHAKSYQLYKTKKQGQLSLWREIPGSQTRIRDTDVSPNTEYEYAVMAVLPDGSYSEMKISNIKY